MPNNQFREAVRTFRAVNRHHGFRARVVSPPSVSWQTNGASTTISAAGKLAGFKLVAPAAEPVRAAIELYDAIGSDFFGDGITTGSVASAMKDFEAAKASVLDIYINSPGGDVFEATAIFNVLDRFPGTKNVYIDGLAASAASYIAMVGNTITTAPNAMWMVHDPWGHAVGNAADLRATADTLDKVAGTLVGTYVSRNRKGASESAMRAIMAAETWMTAEEALAAGFTDAILGGAADDENDENQDEPSAVAADARRTAVLAQYTKTPAALRPDVRALIRSMETRASPRQDGSKGPAKK